MEKLSKYYLSLLIGFTLFTSCKEKVNQMGKTEQRVLAEKVFKEGAHLYQGSPKSMTRIQKAIEIDPTYAEAVREMSVAYLKRGIPHLWKKYMDKAVALNPEVWQGYRGYCYLWFYRDYKKAIADFNASNALNPSFTDAPQGHSVHYWRGIAYLGLEDYKNSLKYFDKYIKEEIEKFGTSSIEVTTYLYKGIVYYEMNDFEKAKENFELLLKNSYGVYADGKYYLALILKKEGKIEDAKKMAISGLKDFNDGYVNQRPYVESMKELYLEDYQQLINEIQLYEKNTIHTN